jgi:beta-1,4-mannosyltransferase
VGAAGPVEVHPYTTRAVLAESWDIVHVCWPEWMITRDRGPLAAAADAVRVLGELRFAKARGARIVWTAHNIRPHETDAFGVADRFVSAVARLADLVICPSQSALDQFQLEYPAITAVDQRVVPEGSYQGIYPDEQRPAAAARRALGLPPDVRIALLFGMVRPYKNIPQVLRCYREIVGTRDDTFLLIAGKPLNARIAQEVAETCAGLPNTRADLRYIADEEIQDYLRASNCLVIATSFALTTGSALLALSFDRPVLLPHRGAAIDIRDAVGSQWVHTYDGGIRTSVLRRAFDIDQPPGRPGLEEHHDWTRAGREYYAAYQSLLRRPVS